MALMANPCWTLVLAACLARPVRADCEKDCDTCLLRLQDRQTDLSMLMCVQECEGSVSTTTSLALCKDVLTEEDPGQGGAAQRDQLATRYGGFMRRYGGFMKKTAEVGVENKEEQEKRSSGFLKKDGGNRLDALKELLEADRERGDGEDFAGAVTRSAELGDGVRALQKRYGGFMRRVGSPNWEESKKLCEGLFRRSWGPGAESSSPRAEKRYGGFMD